MGSLFAIADLHLSFARPKPMDKFGDAWRDHAARIAAAWRAAVGPDDLVLVAGDISWAMKPADAAPDLDWIAALPGRKILGKGNHDYWWGDSARKLAALARPGLRFLGPEPIRDGDYAVAGTRLWDFPECPWPMPPAAPGASPDAPVVPAPPRAGAPDPEVLRRREYERLRARLAALDPAAPVRVCMLHYPPVGADAGPTPLTALMDAFRIDWCVFGHIHGAYPTPPPAARFRLNRTEYALVSVDQIGFAPLRLRE